MHPILGRYGPFFLYSYTVVMGLGLAAGIGVTAWRARESEDRPRNWLDGLLVALGAALVGGRIGYVLANGMYFQGNPGEIGLVWHGGLSYHGALLAALIALWLWSRRRRHRFTDYAGLMAPALALGHVFGWLACYLEGCAYGRETVFGPLAADLPDSFGVFGLRYQTQLMGLASAGLIFVLALAWWRRGGGRLFWATLLALSGSRLVVSTFRGDEIAYVGSLRLDTVLELAWVIVSVAGLLLAGRRRSEHKSRS